MSEIILSKIFTANTGVCLRHKIVLGGHGGHKISAYWRTVDPNKLKMGLLDGDYMPGNYMITI